MASERGGCEFGMAEGAFMVFLRVRASWSGCVG